MLQLILTTMGSTFLPFKILCIKISTWTRSKSARREKLNLHIKFPPLRCLRQMWTSELTCQVLWEELLRMLPLLSTVNSDILDVSEEAGQLYLPFPPLALKFGKILLTELWGPKFVLSNREDQSVVWRFLSCKMIQPEPREAAFSSSH